MLHNKLRSLNLYIENQVRPVAQNAHTAETIAKYKGGIVFPFDQGDDVDPWVILRNIPELAQIYETKVRSPYKVVFEVCRLSELKGEPRPQSAVVSKQHAFGDGGTGSAAVNQTADEQEDHI